MSELDKDRPDDAAQVAFVMSLVTKAKEYAHSDPEVALGQARKAAEAICRHLFARQFGEPGKIMLDAMITKLAQAKAIPQRIQIPLGTIQAYGNFGVHAQSDLAKIEREYVVPCLTALEQVTAWYLQEVDPSGRVGTAPETLVAGAAPRTASPPGASSAAAKRSPLTWGIPAALVVAAAAAALLWGRGREERTVSESVVAEPVKDAGAAPAEVTADAVATPWARAVTLRFSPQVLRKGQATPATMQEGATLAADDRVAFELEVDQPAHVYLVQRTGATGALNVLFPDPRLQPANPLPPNQRVRIPNGERWFRLDDQDLGTERVIVIASPTPLDELESALAQAGENRSRAEKVLVALAAPPPDCKTRALSLDDDDCGLKTRALQLEGEPAAPARTAAAPAQIASLRFRSNDAKGPLVAVFGFRHVARK